MSAGHLAGAGESRRDGTDTLTTLLGVLRVVRTRWYLVLLVFVPMVAGATWYAEDLPDVYETEGIVLLEPRPEAGNASGSSIVRLKAPTYVVYLTAPATTRTLAEDLGLAATTVDQALDASVQNETGNVTVTASSTDPEVATQIVDAATQALVDFSADDDLLQAQLIAPPVVPEHPAGPPRRLIEAAAVTVSLGLAVLLAVLVDRRRPRIAGPRDVDFVTGHELLGRVPQRRRLSDYPAAAFADPAVGTAARSLRVRLVGELRAGSTLTVTSSMSGEGKTTVATLLATAFARSGMTVALVDGDLRRSRLHTFIDDAGPGLAALVRGRVTLEACLRPGWTEHLTVLPTRVDERAGEMLSEHLPDILRDLAARYDIVMIDAPPLLATDEAKLFASSTDAVVTVVAVGTPRDAVIEAHDLLVGLRASVTGYVLNRATVDAGYDTYGYGEE